MTDTDASLALGSRGGWLDALPDDWEPSWLVQDLLLKQGFTMLIGPPKSRKSALRRYFTAAALSGRQALGFPTCQVERALSLVGEGIVEAESTLQHRVCRSFGLRQHEYGKRLWLERPLGLSLSSPAGLSDLLSLVRREKFDFVTLDPLITFHRAEENDNTAMARLCAGLLEVSSLATLLVVHHTAKPSEADQLKTVGQKARGAGALAGFVDTSLALFKRGSSNANHLEIEARYSGLTEGLELTFDHDSGLWSKRAPDDTQRRVLDLLRAEPSLTANEVATRLQRRRSDVLGTVKWFRAQAGSDPLAKPGVEAGGTTSGSPPAEGASV